MVLGEKFRMRRSSIIRRRSGVIVSSGRWPVDRPPTGEAYRLTLTATLKAGSCSRARMLSSPATTDLASAGYREAVLFGRKCDTRPPPAAASVLPGKLTRDVQPPPVPPR